jgi:hypothetical protein
MPLVEKVDAESLIPYEILKNPVLFIEFVRNIDKLPYEETFELTQYQKEIVCDFNSYVSLCTARATGKTVSLSSMITWMLVYNLFPLDYITLLVPNKVHLEPVFTGLIRLFRSNSFLKHFIKPTGGINSSDYSIDLVNSSKLICRIAGQSGSGANVIGLHTPIVFLDEAGYFPWQTFLEAQPIINTWTPGFRVIVSGVPTGLRENNVLYHVDMENSSYTKHRVSSYQNPRVTPEDETRAIEQYGGRDSEDFLHLFLGQHGRPIFALFDRSTFEVGNNPVYRLVLNGIELKDNMSDYRQQLAIFPGLPEKEKNKQVIFGIDTGYCYSSDTDVLTKRGWVKHEDIQKDDIVACYDTQKDEIIWDNFIYLWEQDYKGEMLEVKGKSTNFCVSPKHSIWISNGNGSKYKAYEKLKAEDLLNLRNERFKVKISAKNPVIKGPETFTVPYYYCDREDREQKDTKVKMSVWLQFLGWFISEGSATPSCDWGSSITQRVGENSDKIDEMFKQLPYNVTRKEFTTMWGKQQIDWTIHCKELCLWLRENCGVYSQNKKIPGFVFDCSTEEQELFLRTLLMGDGGRINSKTRGPLYTSSSRKLLDQVQQLALSLGYAATYGFCEKDGMGRVSITKRSENLLFKDNNINKIQYDGKIYCLKTKTGFYVTRREGRVAIQGNTEPSAIVILYVDSRGILKFHGRIRMDKVSYPIQEKLIDFLDTKFNPSTIAIDKGSAGVGLVQNLMEGIDYTNKDYQKRIQAIDFSSSTVIGIDSNGEEIKEKTKPFATSILQDYSNNHKIAYSSTDLDMIVELERMTYTRTTSGEIVYKTLTARGGKRGEDHFTAALLCAVLAYYLNNEYLAYKPKKQKLVSFSWL